MLDLRIPAHWYIEEKILKPIDQAANKAINNVSNTIDKAAKAVNETNSSYTQKAGAVAVITAVVTKAKPGPALLGEAVHYLSNIAVGTVSNAYDYFNKGQK